jgi:putative transposase
MKKTEKGTKKFTKKEQLQIIGEAKKNGVKVTLERYDLFPATYYYWKKKYEPSGRSGLENEVSKVTQSRIKELEKENRLLKVLLGEKELESKLKDELIKKKYPNLRK